MCDGLQRVRLLVDDIVCFSKNGAQRVCDLDRFFERLTTFDMKLAPKKHTWVYELSSFWVTVQRRKE